MKRPAVRRRAPATAAAVRDWAAVIARLDAAIERSRAALDELIALRADLAGDRPADDAELVAKARAAAERMRRARPVRP